MKRLRSVLIYFSVVFPILLFVQWLFWPTEWVHVAARVFEITPRGLHIEKRDGMERLVENDHRVVIRFGNGELGVVRDVSGDLRVGSCAWAHGKLRLWTHTIEADSLTEYDPKPTCEGIK